MVTAYKDQTLLLLSRHIHLSARHCITSSHPCQQHPDLPSTTLHQVSRQGWKRVGSFCTLVWPPAHTLQPKANKAAPQDRNQTPSQSQGVELGAQVPCCTRNGFRAPLAFDQHYLEHSTRHRHSPGLEVTIENHLLTGNSYCYHTRLELTEKG